jgi:phosphoribosylformylglycinamidine (FGAM) synthase-like enzyme
MGQIVGCLEGMGDACRALDYPIVSGNVSLYNESKATGGDSLAFDMVGRGGRQSVSLAELRKAHESFFPRLMGEDAALA